jgi:uncharacterized membrane protein YvlD (DUF360 family)
VTPEPPDEHGGLLRPPAKRPSLRQVLARGLGITVVTTVSLVVLAWVLPGLSIDRTVDALFAGLVLGIVNAVVWPALAFLVVPLSVVTLGLAAVVLDALVVALVLDALPGIHLDGFRAAVTVVIGLAVVTTLVSSMLAVDDDAWFDERMARRARRRRKGVVATDVPGVVFVQIDGLAEVVLRRALRSGDAPTLDGWLRDGTHHLESWETGWSSQTGVSQCGILHGSSFGMPAFRWVEKGTGQVLVSNRPSSAAEIERRHSDGQGLLAHHGSSYGNLFSGDAERAALTMSVVGKTKEGKVGAGYSRYFASPQQATRTLVGAVAEVARERRSARDQVRRDVRPRVARGWEYALLRTFTTIVSRDVCVQAILNDVAEGRAAIYVDFLGYDEVSHHSGPERADSLGVLRDLDRQVARIQHSFQWAPRPYRIVVLSDHGQTQGAAFTDRYGESLADLVARLAGAAASGDPDAEAGRTESSAWFRQARKRDKSAPAAAQAATVLASGSLGLVYLPGEPKRRLFLEEIDERHPGLVAGLVAHPGIGFVMARSRERGAVVLGGGGHHDLDTGTVVGDDPLVPFGATAAAKVREVDAYDDAGDLMVNSLYDADMDEVAAFEAQVGSHGGLGGPQTHPFVLRPADLEWPAEPVVGSVAIHRVLKGWLADLGQPVTLPWRA